MKAADENALSVTRDRSADQEVSGNIVDLVNGRIFPGAIRISGQHIADVIPGKKDYSSHIIPGFIDAHIHIESSMLVPSEFSRMVAPLGTVAAVSDPHEIANILGVRGVEYMVDNGMSVPFKFYFGAPSCVPASQFETSGALLSAEDVENLLRRKDILYLSEMMNFPGVINGDPEVMEKLALAKRFRKPVDGHAPGLTGDALRRYVAAGISTDHETVGFQEGIEKLSFGMKLLIREGSAACNFETLIPLVAKYPDRCMFCSDDRHPDSLSGGHIRDLVKRAVDKGIDVLTALRCASLNPVRHYGLGVGLLQKGDPADFVIVDNLRDLNVLEVYVDGVLVGEKGTPLFSRPRAEIVNNFRALPKHPSDFFIRHKGGRIRVIEVTDGQILTGCVTASAAIQGDAVVSDTDRDILKIAVVNRYRDGPPALGFVKGFSLKKGAIASSVAHDAHNIVAVGVTDRALSDAVNLVVAHKGGLAVTSPDRREVLPLPIAGIMSDLDGHKAAETYSRLEACARAMGSHLRAPLMTLSFMALSVIPALKLTDKGLFDGERFQFTGLFAD